MKPWSAPLPTAELASRLHEQGQCPLRHLSLDASVDGEPVLSEAIHGLALEQLVDQLPAAQATALGLTVLDGLSLRSAAAQLEISPMAVLRTREQATRAPAPVALW